MERTHHLLLEHWGNRIREQRGERTQTWLAEAVGCDQTTISRIERGHYNLSVELMVGIAAAFESELEQIFSFPPGLVSRELYQRTIKQGAA